MQSRRSTEDRILDAVEPSVIKCLKSPLSAVLCSPEELVITKDGKGLYFVRGHVNSQNSYGAMIKTDFLSKVTKNNGKWVVVSTTVGEQAAKNLVGVYAFGIAVTAVLYLLFRYVLI